MKNDYKIIDHDEIIVIKNQFGHDIEVPVTSGTIIIYANAYGRKWEIFIDEEDLAKVDEAVSGRWYVSIKKDTIYASFCKQKDNVRTYIHMHRLIANCPEGLVVDHHHHHYGLDNRRHNLRVVTAEENNRNQIKSRTNKFMPAEKQTTELPNYQLSDGKETQEEVQKLVKKY